MPNLSKNRLDELKHSKNYTFKDISDKTGLPQSTIAKIFGGFNKNPTIESLQKIAKALECSIDDFIEYENTNIPFFTDQIANKFSQDIKEKPALKQLFDTARTLKEDDVELLVKIATRLKK